MLSVSGVSSNVFIKSPSVKMVPQVSAEWNQNIFNPPYITVAGPTAALSANLSNGYSVDTVTDSNKHDNFDTFSFTMAGPSDKIFYTFSSDTAYPAYKIVTYVKTDSDDQILISTSGYKELYHITGSSNYEINSFDWTKVITYVSDTSEFDSFELKIQADLFSSDENLGTIYYTKPEAYPVSISDYRYGSIWPTDSAFLSFRPGESYVTTGNSNFTLPDNFRKINSSGLLNGYASTFTMPVSPITSNQNFIYTSSPVPLYKNSLMTDISSYQYFISGEGNSNMISGKYASPIMTNKIVIKMNTFLSTPHIQVKVTKTDGTVITSSTFSKSNGISDAGVLVLYLNSGAFTTTRWSTMPSINDDGSISNYIEIKDITVIQVDDSDVRSQFVNSNASMAKDKNKMHIVEVSPRLELDLTKFVISMSVNKALDSKDTYMPISAMSTDDAMLSLSSIPLGSTGNPVPVFSNISNLSSSKLAGLLRKNVKFYLNYSLNEYYDADSNTNVSFSGGKTIPAGVFYSDAWEQADIDSVTIQCFDTTRYMQYVPASDNVIINRNAFDVISQIMESSGFTDFDADSLYNVCNDKNVPIHIDYYYCSSKDTTLVDALNKIFLPYQIGAYMDNYGVMKFLSLSNILKSSKSSNDFVVDDSVVVQNGYSISNKAKPGKISLRYQAPKLKQSLSIQNVKDVSISTGPSYVYTTSNDVVWSQQNIDSVGLNYIAENIGIDDNYFKVSKSDLLDSFHTFNLNTNGYVVIENEILSFVYKEYIISKLSDPYIDDQHLGTSVKVSVKNDIELAAEVNRFIKNKQIGLIENVGIISSATPGTPKTIGSKNYKTTTYGFSSSPTSDVAHPFVGVKAGQYVSVTGMSPESLNVHGEIISVSGNTFTVITGSDESKTTGWTKGRFTTGFDYDVDISPTGKITNVQRGAFGTNVNSHSIISSNINDSGFISAKSDGLRNSIDFSGYPDTYMVPSSSSDISTYGNSIVVKPDKGSLAAFSASGEDSADNKTFSVKFNLTSQNTSAAGICLNYGLSGNNNGAYFVEFIQHNSKAVVTNNTLTVSGFDPRYYIAIYKHESDGVNTLKYYAPITGTVLSIKNNFEKIWKKKDKASQTGPNDLYEIYSDPREVLNMRFVRYPYKNDVDGEGTPSNASAVIDGYVFSVFLNNFEISGWREYSSSAGEWVEMGTNAITKNKKKPILESNPELNFANSSPYVYFTDKPININSSDSSVPNWSVSNFVDNSVIGILREIYSTEKILKERSVNYYYQDREFLNAIVQGQNFINNYRQSLVQTEPAAVGLNIYDVQYTNPAAVTVDILPVEYAWFYYPGGTLLDQAYKQHQIVDEYSVSYSTPINTGFRGKFALVNNSSHMVYLKKDSDELNQFAVNLNLWTHEIITQSDPEIIEYVTDIGNLNEVVQIDSSWIQSKEVANKLLKLVGHGLDFFSKSVSLNIFGNPLIEIGDIIQLTYPLMGINQQKFMVHGVGNSYDTGLTTRITLIKLNNGVKL